MQVEAFYGHGAFYDCTGYTPTARVGAAREGGLRVREEQP